MKLPTLILASASPRRLELFRQTGLEFQAVTSGAEEIHQEQLTAGEREKFFAGVRELPEEERNNAVRVCRPETSPHRG